MVNKIEQGTERVRADRGGALNDTARANYRAATIEAPREKKRPNWQGLIDSGSKLFGQYTDFREDQGKKRAAQIIAELTPDERREAIQNGNLLYQDDPYAMRHFKRDSARQAAMEKDIETQRMIREGTKGLRTKEEIDQYLAEDYTRAKAVLASDLNVSENDPQLIEGWHDNFQRRAIALRETFDQVESKRFVDKAVLLSTSEARSMFSDPSIAADPEMSGNVIQYLQTKYENGTIPTPEAYAQIVQSSLRDLSSTPNRTETLLYLADEPISIHGAQTTLRDFMGTAEYDNLIMESENASLTKQIAVREEFGGFKAGIQAQIILGNFNEADRLLDSLATRNANIQNSDLASTFKDELIALRTSVTTGRARAIAENRTALTKQAKIAEGVEHYKRMYDARSRGEIVSLDPSAQDIEYAVEANKAFFAQFNKQAMEAYKDDPEVLAHVMMQMAAMSPEGSPARQALSENITLASQSLNSLAAMDDSEIDFEKDMEVFDRLALMYNANPVQFGAVSPEMAGQIQVVAKMNSMGLNGSKLLIDSIRAEKAMDEVQRQQKRQEWEGATNDSKFRSLVQGDSSLNRAGYTIFQALTANNINSTEAAETATKMLLENTAPISMEASGSIVGNRTERGLINKNVLMTNPANPDSWRTGADIVQNTFRTFIGQNPQLNPEGWSIHQMAQNPDMVIIKHVSGINPYIMPMSSVREEAQRLEAAEQQRLHDEAVKKGQSGGGVTFEHKRQYGAPLFEFNKKVE